VARRSVERPDDLPHRRVVARVAPLRDVERAPAREEVEDVVGVEDLRAPAQEDEVDVEAGRGAGRADEVGERREGEWLDGDALARERGGNRLRPRLRGRVLGRVRELEV